MQKSVFERWPDDRRALIAFRLVLLCLGVWLAWSLTRVNIEFGDGYSTIANAQYFLGDAHPYFWQRGPMLALLLVPAEWLAQTLQLHPLNVRTHHAIVVLLHFLYLIGVWRLLATVFGAGLSTALAFVAAVPTVVYFSYAPFLSHDLLPGFGLLFVLLRSHQFIERPNTRDWLLFSVACLALVLLKQTYALIPICVLVGRVCANFYDVDIQRLEVPRVAALVLATAIVGAITWIVYAALAGETFADTSFMLRPWAAIEKLTNFYSLRGPLNEMYYTWIYFRNASAYGIVAMTLVLPGVALALWSGTRLQRQAALTWLLLVIAMQLTPFKEVRYLAFLAPLSAFLLIPVVRYIWSDGHRYRWLLIMVLLIDLTRAGVEAMRLRDPYYQTAVTTFLGPLDSKSDAGKPVFFGNGWLSFVSPERDAFYGDVFHRITELQIEQLRALYGWSATDAIQVHLSGVPDLSRAFPRATFVLQNAFLSRLAYFGPTNDAGLAPNFTQVVAYPETLVFTRAGDRYRMDGSGEAPRLLVRESGGPNDFVLVRGEIDAERLRRFAAFDGLPGRVVVVGLRVSTICTLTGCAAYAESSSSRSE